MHLRLTPWCGVFLFSGTLCAAVSAQTRPEIAPLLPNTPGASQRDDASQELIRQQERERLLRQQQERNPDVRLIEAPAAVSANRLPAGEAPCFTIDQLVLRGEDAAQFQWALKGASRDDLGAPDSPLGRCLGTQAINVLMGRMQNAIIARGYVTTRVLAEPQDLSRGTLALSVIPGRIRQIGFAPGTNPRGTWWNAVPARPGDLLNVRDTEQALENFKRVPTAEADIQIMPAEGGNAKPGESDLQIQWKQGLPFRLALGLDDGGSRSTGKLQGSVTLSYDHWLTLGVQYDAFVGWPGAGKVDAGLLAKNTQGGPASVGGGNGLQGSERAGNAGQALSLAGVKQELAAGATGPGKATQSGMAAAHGATVSSATGSAAQVAGAGGASAGRMTVIGQVALANPSGRAQVVRTTSPSTQIPNASLFRTSPGPASRFLVETDARFANYKDWTGSDYLTSKVQLDPTVTQKRLTGSSILSDDATKLLAGNNITIDAATNTVYELHHSSTKKSGFMSSGGIGFSYGTKTTTVDQERDATLQSGEARSSIGATGGALTMVAGNNVTIGGSDILAATDLDIIGKSVTIKPGQDNEKGKFEVKTTQDGLTLALGGSVISAIQTLQTMSTAASTAKDGRVTAMAAATTAMAASDAAKDMMKEGGPSISISLTAGHSESIQTQNTASTTHSGSVLTGNNINITAMGGGKDSNINILGSDLNAKNDIRLHADNNVNLLAAQDTESQHSKSSSLSASVGVKAIVSTQGTSFGFTASVSGSKGHEDGDGTTQLNTHVNAGDKLVISSGGDTNIKGAVASANQVIADIKGNLNLESLQDLAKFDSKSQSISASGTVGIGASVSGS